MTSTSSGHQLCLYPGQLIWDGWRCKAVMKTTAFEERAVERRGRREFSLSLLLVGFGMVELRAHSGNDLLCPNRLANVDSQRIQMFARNLHPRVRIRHQLVVRADPQWEPVRARGNETVVALPKCNPEVEGEPISCL
jgi:hypothetical protein